jgi:lactoylglutathione lyase
MPMKYLHTMLRVTDPDRSLRFYCDGLGFELVRRQDHDAQRFSLYFLRVGPGSEPELELTHNWDTKQYAHGDAYGHMAYRVDSIDTVREQLQAHGYDLSWGPGLTPDGRTRMAFVDDPDGYEIELLEPKA